MFVYAVCFFLHFLFCLFIFATYIVCLSARPPMRLIPEAVGHSKDSKDEAARTPVYRASERPLK